MRLRNAAEALVCGAVIGICAVFGLVLGVMFAALVRW
jgi:hypothetical protein